MARDFREMLEKQWGVGKFLSVGLDPDLDKMPSSGEAPFERIVAFNKDIVNATKDIVGSYKPNSAFYEAFGEEGFRALKATVAHIHEVAPELPIILDAKRGDIGSTNRGYVAAAYDHLGVDAITVHPYLGAEALAPFLERTDKGVLVMCRNSNPGAGEFQDLLVDGEPLYMRVAKQVSNQWNKNGNCGLVVGATYPEEIAHVRDVAPDITLLIPGVGAQGGDLERSVKAARHKFILSTSRAVIYASQGPDFAEAARAKAQELDSAIQKALLE